MRSRRGCARSRPRSGALGAGLHALALRPTAVTRRLVPAAAAVLFTAWSAAALPFFPAGWPLALAALAGVVALWNQRLALAFCLAVPVLPLGNYALGLAVLYAAAALVWLVVSWRDPEAGLFMTLGPLLASIGLIAALPVAGLAIANPWRRGVQVAMAVVAAAAVAGASQARPPRHRRIRSPGRGGQRSREGLRARDDRPGGRARPRRRRPAVRARARPVGHGGARGRSSSPPSCSRRRRSRLPRSSLFGWLLCLGVLARAVRARPPATRARPAFAGDGGHGACIEAGQRRVDLRRVRMLSAYGRRDHQ